MFYRIIPQPIEDDHNSLFDYDHAHEQSGGRMYFRNSTSTIVNAIARAAGQVYCKRYSV